MLASMHLPVVGALIGLAAAQTFEPADFNVTESLLDLGVNVTQIPELETFVERSGDFACASACIGLSVLYGNDAVYTQDEAPYSTFTGGYWALNQAESGGHAAFAGASSISGGITVSFEKMKSIKLSQDKKSVTIQPGNNWSNVYSTLEQSDLTVSGGRVSGVGTGGLTLGGGISFFSNIHGWACDSVISYEVVTASGIIVRASSTSNPRLYWALRGGGNNFGIVTAFTFETIPLPGGQLWGGTKTYLENDFDAVADAFAGVVADSPTDPNAGLWVAWLSNSGFKLAATELWYAKPDGSDAAIFDAFNAITPVADTTQNRIISEYTEVQQAANPYGLREVYYGLTVKASPEIARIARDIFFEEQPATVNIAGANPVLIFQGITEGQLSKMTKNGGNPLGLSAADGPFYLIHIACWWENQEDDAAIYKFISKVLTRIDNSAEELGLQNDYVYMNYASQYENVIATYGADNVAELKRIARLYDPAAVFQTLQPGHFKLDRAPVASSCHFTGVRN